MRVLIFHGYLLEGTGSNVYNARLAEALARQGHEVHLLCQERHPLDQPFVDAAGDWDAGSLALRVAREPVRCTVYRPDIGGLLPVYVPDRYEGLEARPFTDCTDGELAFYVDANVAAVREVAERVDPDVALANHLVMGPLVLARSLGPLGVPYAVKIHGSALEYTVKRQPERFLAPAREGVRPARGILVGSSHTAHSLWSTLDDPDLRVRTRLGPPGVDTERFAPRSPPAAASGLRALADRLRDASPTRTEGAFARDPRAAAQALERLDSGADRLVAFVGKLIAGKGADLLLAAFPLVLARQPSARLVVVGFGDHRTQLEHLLCMLADGDLDAARELARADELHWLLSFLDGLDGAARDAYLHAATALRDRVVMTGRLDHDELPDLLPACDALAVPSTFPEAFGMVAVEGAACGALPVSADHSGLAEVSAALARAVPSPAARLLSFPVGDRAVPDLAERLIAWLEAPSGLRDATRAGLVEVVRERYSWEGVARTVLAAARGELDDLPVADPAT